MYEAHRRPRPAFTLIELLVVMALILAIFALGIGYVVFGRDNEKTVLGAQSVSGAIINARGRARRDGRPTGIRVLFGGAAQATQFQFIQQPEDYNAGLCTGNPTSPPNLNVVTFQTGTVDFVGGGDPSNPLTWTVQPNDYFLVTGVPTPHRILSVAASPPSLTLQSPAPLTSGTAYNIVRAPRPIPSEDLITLPAGFVIDKAGCNNTLPTPDGQDGDLVFAPSGGVVSQGAQGNKIFLWVCAALPAANTAGSPLIVTVQVRTGAVGSYPVLPGNPYFYANDPRASGI